MVTPYWVFVTQGVTVWWLRAKTIHFGNFFSLNPSQLHGLSSCRERTLRKSSWDPREDHIFHEPSKHLPTKKSGKNIICLGHLAHFYGLKRSQKKYPPKPGEHHNIVALAKASVASAGLRKGEGWGFLRRNSVNSWEIHGKFTEHRWGFVQRDMILGLKMGNGPTHSWRSFFNDKCTWNPSF